jgi:hypothetical protein
MKPLYRGFLMPEIVLLIAFSSHATIDRR